MNQRIVRREHLALARCKEACPAGVDAPRYIRRIQEGKFDEALAIIRERIPFPSICGHACYSPCEAHCGNRQFGDPIAIRALKWAAAEKGGDLWRKNLSISPPTGKRVAVVGSGPSGLTAAYFLAILGHKVTVLEALHKAGGMMRAGIPKYRLPREALDEEIGSLKEIGVEILTGRKVESLDSLFAEGYDAVYLACGAQQGARLGIPGEDTPGVMDGISFLKKVNLEKTPEIGSRVAVIGGGNTAVDAARCAVRLGAKDVVVIYRRSQIEMTAYEEEVKCAIFEGVTLEYLAAPVRIVSKNSALEVTLIRMRLGKPDATGRRSPVAIPGSEFTTNVDNVIIAAGQIPAIPAGTGIKLDESRRTAVVAPETLQTNKKGVFAGGDLVSGPASIIEAIAHGRKAASSIDKFLGGAGKIDQKLAPAEQEVAITDRETQVPRVSVPTVPLAERSRSFRPVELGLTDRDAIKEAQRCRSCDARQFEISIHPEGCKECGYCVEVCGLDVFEFEQKFNSRGYRPILARRRERCVGCMLCFYACPDFSIDISEKESDEAVALANNKGSCE